MNITDKLICGGIHWIFSVFMALYAFMFRTKNGFDYVYLYILMLVILSWTLFNGECVLSYFIKRDEDPTYEAGQATNEAGDLVLLRDYQEAINVVLFIGQFITCIGMYIVFTRNQVTPFISIPTVLTYILYKMVTRLNEDHTKNVLFLEVQSVAQAVIVGMLVVFTGVNIMSKEESR
jgi:hypothetical protein